MLGPASTPNGSAQLVKVTVSVGGGSQSANSANATQTQEGSTIDATGNVAITATGSGATNASGIPTDGDLLLQGAKVQAGGNVSLTAAHDIDLLASQDTSTQSSSNHSSSGSVGVGFALGGQQNGFTLELAAAEAQGKTAGNRTTNTLTQIDAGKTLSLTSGNDTTLDGAQAHGQTVIANVGGNLNLTSTQDSSYYREQDQSASAGVSLCIPPFCYGSSSVSASANDTAIHDDYQSVTGQTGIAAGSGGYQIVVGGTTSLAGAALASSADGSKNLLDTGNLTVASLQNHQSDSASQTGITVNTGGGLGQNLLSNTAGAALSLAVPQGGNANSTTQSSIAPGTIDVRNNPTQDLSGIDRSSTLDGNGVSNDFNVAQIKENQALGQGNQLPQKQSD